MKINQIYSLRFTQENVYKEMKKKIHWLIKLNYIKKNYLLQRSELREWSNESSYSSGKKMNDVRKRVTATKSLMSVI